MTQNTWKTNPTPYPTTVLLLWALSIVYQAVYKVKPYVSEADRASVLRCKPNLLDNSPPPHFPAAPSQGYSLSVSLSTRLVFHLRTKAKPAAETRCFHCIIQNFFGILQTIFKALLLIFGTIKLHMTSFRKHVLCGIRDSYSDDADDTSVTAYSFSVAGRLSGP